MVSGGGFFAQKGIVDAIGIANINIYEKYHVI